MNNLIAYVVQQNNNMTHSMSLNNRISYVVGIFIFGFNTLWQRVFNFMEIKTKLIFKQFLQDKTLNSDKNKLYYQ